MKVVLGLSGGMDSATLCGYFRHLGAEIHPVNFNYGSKHNKYETEAAEKIAKFYELPEIVNIDLPFIGQLFKSNLLKTGGDIPEGHYNDASMSQTVVPGRNTIFVAIMMGYAWSIGADIVAVGVHAGDHAIYDDCRPEFIFSMQKAVVDGSGARVQLSAPFLYDNKTSILKLGYRISPAVPYELTRTCYKDQFLSCGKCGSCQERLEAFANIGRTDPIQYESPVKK
jgi:7-cyano-7-deazaguanine synthase